MVFINERSYDDLIIVHVISQSIQTTLSCVVESSTLTMVVIRTNQHNIFGFIFLSKIAYNSFTYFSSTYWVEIYNNLSCYFIEFLVLVLVHSRDILNANYFCEITRNVLLTVIQMKIGWLSLEDIVNKKLAKSIFRNNPPESFLYKEMLLGWPQE